MDAVRDGPRASEEIRDEVMSFIDEPKNKKSAKMCSRCQNQNEKNCKEEENRKLDSEITLVDCFSKFSHCRQARSRNNVVRAQLPKATHDSAMQSQH